MRQPSQEDCELATEAVRTGFGLRVAALMPLPTWNSTVFRVDTDAGRFALRAHDKSRPEKDILLELAFLRHLVDRGLPVPLPRKSTTNGDLYVPATAGRRSYDLGQVVRSYDLTTWLPGAVRRDELEPRDARQLGVCLAGIHEASRDFPCTVDEAGRDKSPIEAPWALPPEPSARLDEIASWLSPADLALLREVFRRIRSVITRLGGDELEAGIVHNDFILGNCMWHEGSVSVIDFADCRVAPYLYDLAPMLTNIGEEPRLRAAFFFGYRSIRPLSAAQEDALPAFEAIRHLSSCFSMIDRAQQGAYGPALDVHIPYRVGELRKLLNLM